MALAGSLKTLSARLEVYINLGNLAPIEKHNGLEILPE